MELKSNENRPARTRSLVYGACAYLSLNIFAYVFDYRLVVAISTLVCLYAGSRPDSSLTYFLFGISASLFAHVGLASAFYALGIGMTFVAVPVILLYTLPLAAAFFFSGFFIREINKKLERE